MNSRRAINSSHFVCSKEEKINPYKKSAAKIQDEENPKETRRKIDPGVRSNEFMGIRMKKKENTFLVHLSSFSFFYRCRKVGKKNQIEDFLHVVFIDKRCI